MQFYVAENKLNSTGKRRGLPRLETKLTHFDASNGLHSMLASILCRRSLVRPAVEANIESIHTGAMDATLEA